MVSLLCVSACVPSCARLCCKFYHTRAADMCGSREYASLYADAVSWLEAAVGQLVVERMCEELRGNVEAAVHGGHDVRMEHLDVHQDENHHHRH